ncbi:hypothetical protein KMC49_gp45 [Ralstonia phage Firinga]|uniref:Uncharacterized protein n=2 Tax=Firingavirus firinga TaxID=2846043 RepID=A0A7G5B9Z0_9CAUD|nr:hypothetical protein KMC49_gp45 [Ralstonia phage Firinga]QMV33113.1 hypothetical protein 18C_00045 [Ralstonia phage Firinga]QMV33344.1 hypothetical protein 12C_00034 [Ralstonia phage Hennie]
MKITTKFSRLADFKAGVRVEYRDAHGQLQTGTITDTSGLGYEVERNNADGSTTKCRPIFAFDITRII